MMMMIMMMMMMMTTMMMMMMMMLDVMIVNVAQRPQRLGLAQQGVDPALMGTHGERSRHEVVVVVIMMMTMIVMMMMMMMMMMIMATTTSVRASRGCACLYARVLEHVEPHDREQRRPPTEPDTATAAQGSTPTFSSIQTLLRDQYDDGDDDDNDDDDGDDGNDDG
jgi:hypothetical protein